MENSNSEYLKANIITIDNGYKNLVSRVNVQGEPSFYYLNLISELKDRINHLSIMIENIESYQNEINCGITINDKLEMLPDEIRKLMPEGIEDIIVADPDLLKAQKGRMTSIVLEYQRLIPFLEEKAKSSEIQISNDSHTNTTEQQSEDKMVLAFFYGDSKKSHIFTKWFEKYRYTEDNKTNLIGWSFLFHKLDVEDCRKTEFIKLIEKYAQSVGEEYLVSRIHSTIAKPNIKTDQNLALKYQTILKL